MRSLTADPSELPRWRSPLGALALVRADSLRRNSLWLMATTVINLALGYGYWLLVARMFPAAQLGLATSLIALMTITSLAANVGAPSALIQLLPRRATPEDWSNTVSAGLISACLASVAAAGVILLVLPSLSRDLAIARSQPELAGLFVVGTGVATLGLVLDYVFISERASRRSTVRAIVFGLAKLPLVALPAAAAVTDRSAGAIFASWVIGSAISCGFVGRSVLERVRESAHLTLRRTWRELRAMSRNLAGNYLIGLGNALPTYLLPVVVLTRLSPAQSAYFYITWMVGGLFFMISSAIGSSLFAEGAHEPERLRAKVLSSARFAAVLIVPAMLVVALLGRTGLNMFGPEYGRAGYTLLLILTVAAIPDAITNLYVPVLRVRDRLRDASLLTMGMAIFAVVGSWIVAPEHGLTGIGEVWLASQALGSLWVGWDVLSPVRRLRALRAQPRREATDQV